MLSSRGRKKLNFYGGTTQSGNLSYIFTYSFLLFDFSHAFHSEKASAETEEPEDARSHTVTHEPHKREKGQEKF